MINQQCIKTYVDWECSSHQNRQHPTPIQSNTTLGHSLKKKKKKKPSLRSRKERKPRRKEKKEIILFTTAELTNSRHISRDINGRLTEGQNHRCQLPIVSTQFAFLSGPEEGFHANQKQASKSFTSSPTLPHRPSTRCTIISALVAVW